MADILHNDDDIFVYTGGEQEVPHDVRRAKIDECIDTIPANAFADCEQLIELEGHGKLMKVEEGAFLRCRRLRRVTNMGGVKEIEEDAFLGCYALSDLDFDKLEIIGDAAFACCKSLSSINLTFVRRVGGYAFEGCWALTDAAFGEDLEIIEKGDPFCECPSLRRIAIPLKDGLIVENNVFNHCENLSRIDIVGASHKTISSLHLESWKDTMNAEINRINQTLPDTRSAEKPAVIRQWMRSIIDRMEHYKTEHQIVLKEGMTLLELALWKANLDQNGGALEGVVRVTRRQTKRARKERCITSGAGIVIKNVLPFLQLS